MFTRAVPLMVAPCHPLFAGANVRLKGLLAAIAAYSGLRAPPRPRSAKGLKPNGYLLTLDYLFPLKSHNHIYPPKGR